MTAKLLPAFLQCFDDQYLSIRCECCITCGNLQIKEEQIIDKLIHLATFDPIWKVKALAIQGKQTLFSFSVLYTLLLFCVMSWMDGRVLLLLFLIWNKNDFWTFYAFGFSSLFFLLFFFYSSDC